MNSLLWKISSTTVLISTTVLLGHLVYSHGFAAGTVLHKSTHRMRKWMFSLGKQDGEDEDGMPILPKEVVKYSQVPKDPKVFTATTTPKGLLNRHNTKDGTWGVIRILKGSLEYKIAPRGNTMKKEKEEEDDAVAYPTQFVLSPDSEKQGIIEPKRFHKVVPGRDVEYVVEFYRLPGTGAVDEKRE